MLEIIIDKNQEEEKIALLENGNLIEYYDNNLKENRNEGNIYLGIVKDIIPGMQSAFVDIGTEKNSFIHLKDILPKVDETKEKQDLSLKISDVIKPNQKILVQVKKDSNEQKGARVSTHINLPGRYTVLMPDVNIITISQKIEEKAEQQKLIEIVKNNISNNNGAIIRTSAKGKEKEIIEDIKNLENKWQKIKETFKNQEKQLNEGKLLYKAENIVQKMIIDLSGKNIEKITVNNKQENDDIVKFIEENIKNSNIKVEYLEKPNILSEYYIDKQLEKISKRKIWLKCGGFITIDKTEALTAIDVNTGKYTGNKDIEQTIYTVNKEATIEIAKQLRLRDIGGIIIIDYIDMKNQINKQKIEELLKERLKEDRSKTQVEGFTKLDLMEMTRKHICSHKE